MHRALVIGAAAMLLALACVQKSALAEKKFKGTKPTRAECAAAIQAKMPGRLYRHARRAALKRCLKHGLGAI